MLALERDDGTDRLAQEVLVVRAPRLRVHARVARPVVVAEALVGELVRIVDVHLIDDVVERHGLQMTEAAREIPVLRRDDDRCLRVELAHGLARTHLEVPVVAAGERLLLLVRLIEEIVAVDDVLVTREPPRDLAPGRDELGGVVGVVVHADLTVVFPVASARRIVHVDDELDTVLPRPGDEVSLEKVELRRDPRIEPGELFILRLDLGRPGDAVPVHLEAHQVAAHRGEVAEVGLDGDDGTHHAPITDIVGETCSCAQRGKKRYGQLHKQLLSHRTVRILYLFFPLKTNVGTAPAMPTPFPKQILRFRGCAAAPQGDSTRSYRRPGIPRSSRSTRRTPVVR